MLKVKDIMIPTLPGLTKPHIAQVKINRQRRLTEPVLVVIDGVAGDDRRSRELLPAVRVNRVFPRRCR